MHAVFMTFEYSGDSNALTKTLNAFADTLNEERGLVSNTWMRDGATIGGFHMFRTMQAADRFLKSGRMRALTANSRVSGVYVQIFSALTNVAAPLMTSDLMMQPADGIAAGDAIAWSSDRAPSDGAPAGTSVA